MRHDLKTLTILFRAHKAMLDVMRDDVRQHGISVTAFGVLEALYHKGPLDVKTITERVLVADSSMSYTLEKLGERGFIVREKNPDDGRGKIVKLTSSGEAFMAAIYPAHHERLRKRLDVLDATDEATLRVLLKRLGKGA
ncbi:MAG: MarR family transcriptional regulator [Acholeplasmatales bacterium]|nr:MAG: MarR family transcriptional regulator [Acholeplasmatales bacterium]